MITQVKYDCQACHYILGPYTQTSETEIKVSSCPNCQSKGPFTVNVEQTIYRNYQKITLQVREWTPPVPCVFPRCSPNAPQCLRYPYRQFVFCVNLGTFFKCFLQSG
jgi:hypothetical protein